VIPKMRHKEIDQLWAQEAESRIDAYEQGRINAITLDQVLEKYIKHNVSPAHSPKEVAHDN
jgi:hypothetical protein